MRNFGTIVTMPGIIIVLSTSTKMKSLPKKSIRANAYPASDAVNARAITQITATMTLFANQRSMFESNTVRYASKVGFAGQKSDFQVSNLFASACVFSDVDMEKMNGKNISKATAISAI